eukprot:CAMPEP_0201121710 /NCGR_PEP_ID=MMETSP0850-20130426/5537_1 /ASSEMBLY_ACC=CAM_ASM_000622 /TAXON_ID=183588 /ORGANISM="Pseudo-nitzschia fraudulenta, Strain WWA7" /LENGTH=746 /DNA_ID=CAMNT_0047388251 /DNA_START=171 /DNA_END=2411 /DNA_ORIENTATION=+
MTSHNTSKTRIHLHRLFWSVALVLCGRFGNAAAASVDALIASNNSNSNNDGIISLKLNPRHVELDRRRQRNLSSEEGSTNSDDAEEHYRRRTEAAQVGALFEGYGTHYIDLWCGSPPQRQTVIVDTGSGITAFPCSGCRDCGSPKFHIDNLFKEGDSSTFHESTCSGTVDCIMQRSNCRAETCAVSMAYAEGSRWNAYEAVDRCYVGGPHETPLVTSEGSSLEGDGMNPRHAADMAFDMTFGCQTLVTGLFKTQLADGIMGMSDQKSTYWSQMFDAGKMGSDKQFSLCFSRPPNPSREGTEAGAMTLGGSDERLHLTPMVFTPNFNKGRTSFFSVKVRRMMLRDGKFGESVKSTSKNPNQGVVVLDVPESTLNKGGVIVDSGTTDTYWNTGISAEFKKAFQDFAGFAHSNNEVTITEAEMKALPTILIQLYSDDITNSHVDDAFKTPGLTGALDPEHKSDVILAIPPSHYMEYNPNKDSYTSRFYATERAGSVLGANAMMGHDIFFDIETKRIGWSESDCNYTDTVQKNGYSFEITGKLNDVEEVGVISGKGNKHADAAVASEPEVPETCESVSSGAKCQTIEGCTWGWGKCTKASDAAAETPPPVAAEVPPETPLPTEAPKEKEKKEYGQNADLDLDMKLDASLVEQLQENAYAVGAGVALLLVGCCTYCLFCRTDESSKGGKYARASLEPSVSIEMTNGGVEPRRLDSFQDEPGSSNSSISSGSKTSSKFRDDPSEPEFEGDFA